MSRSFRLGVDFGYGYTGIALLDSKNKVLSYKVLKHRQDLSKTLETRRANRASRRRALSKKRRLRDFYALLKGMEIEPKSEKPGYRLTERDKASLGNRLYALAHYRGWDYASLLEMLISNTDGDKAPTCPFLVKEVDRMLIQEFKAPVEFDKTGRKKRNTESDAEYKKAQEQAKTEFNEKANNFNGQSQKFSLKTIPFVRIKTTCLGELYEIAKDIHDLRKKLEKDSSLEQQLVEKEDNHQILETKLKEAKVDQIKKWIEERLDKVFLAHSGKLENKQDIVSQIMTKLGLQTGEELFEEGKIYRPHRNRHRQEMQNDLEKLMKIACGLNNNDIQIYLEGTFNRLAKSKFNKKKLTLSQKQIKEDWQKQIQLVQKKAEELAKKTNSSSKEVKEQWIKSAQKILNREYRKKRFENRNSMGKCPAQLKNNKRCGKNVPKKLKEDIRKFQFEIELRQMNVKRQNGETEKLNGQEVQELMGQLIFKRKPKQTDKQTNRKFIKDFFTDKNGNRYVPPARNEARGKKDILRDIICGEQKGRAGFCAEHLKEKLQLLKNKETKGEKWQNLHEERILSLEKDAPPSIRQKVQKTVGLAKKMLKKQGVNLNQIEHIGIETARFDISSLAQAEGKALKKKPKKYQESARGDKQTLIEDQNGHCLFCGEALYSDSHIDHLFPKSRGGGNIALNKVAGHAICNINKNQWTASLNEQVLSSIKDHNPKKYNFIKKRLESDNKLPQDMLDAPQHTMFGAKLLKGAFIEEFNLSADKIQNIRPESVKYLRWFWFPFMDRQKRALRSKNLRKATAGEEYKLNIEKLKLSEELFNGELSIVRLNNKGENWLALKNEKIKGIPKENEAGINTFALRDDSSKKLILSVEEISQEENKKPKEIYKTSGEIGQKMEISLKDIFAKDNQIKKLFEQSEGLAQVEFRKEEDWLKIDGDKLIGTPELSSRNNNSSYVPWCDLKIYSSKDQNSKTASNSSNSQNTLKQKKLKTAQPIKTFKIKTQISEKALTIAVHPKKDDPIRDFHHALDAVVLASKANWRMISQLNKDVRERDYIERIKMLKEARKDNAPVFSDLQESDKGDLLAPLKSSNWYVKDKQNQRKIEFSKTDREPLRRRSDKVLQKKPLEKIEKKNVENIQSAKIREAMEKAFEEINKMSEDEIKQYSEGKGQDQKISQNYFLNLNQDHILYPILHPKNTRSALCKIGGTGVSQLWMRADKKTKGKHYFKRMVGWQTVQVIKYKDNKGREKTQVVRLTHKFYWQDKTKPSYERNEIDKKLPDKYKVIKEFSSGDRVKIEGQEGKWKITKLGKIATLESATGAPKSSAWTKLS